MSKTTQIIRALLLTSFIAVLCLNSTKANIHFDSNIYKNREANTKLIQYVHERITGAKSASDSIKLYGKSYFFAHGMHGPAVWNQLITKYAVNGKAKDYAFFLKLLQDNIITLKHIKYNTYQITVDGNPFNFFFYGAKKECPKLFDIKCCHKNPQYLASLVIGATKCAEGTGGNHVNIEDGSYPFEITSALENAKNKLFAMIANDYPQMTVPAGIIRALEDGCLTVQPFDKNDASKLKIKINNIEICSLRILAKQNAALKKVSANFDDYEINRQTTLENLKFLKPNDVKYSWKSVTDNIIKDVEKTIQYKFNRNYLANVPSNANPNLLIDLDGNRIGEYNVSNNIDKLLRTAFYGTPLFGTGNGRVTAKFQNEINTILKDFAKALAQMTSKRQQRDAVLTLAAAADHCAASIAFNLSQIVTNLSADYLSGCRNMLIAGLEGMRKGLLTQAVIDQRPDILHYSQNAHTFCYATKKCGERYMLANWEVAVFNDSFSGLAGYLNEEEMNTYFQTHYTPETIVRFLQNEFITSTTKYKNKDIRELMAEWAVATKLCANDSQFYRTVCDQEWDQDEYMDVANDQFMLYLLMKTGFIKRK